MAARVSYLYKCCPACGGRARAEAKLPLAHAQRPEEHNLDDLAGLVEGQTVSFLLALVELLPYKIFSCRKCGYEFQLQNHAAKELVHSMLAALQPVAAAASPARKTRSRVTVRLPMPAPAAPTQSARPAAASAAAPAAQAAPAQEGPAAAPDWEPYHLDSDMDAIFEVISARDDGSATAA